MAVAGRVAPVPQGEYSSTRQYKRLDVVTLNNRVYMAKKDSVGQPLTDEEYWMYCMGIDASAIQNDIDALKNPEFEEEAERTNVVSGDSNPTLWGKVKKWFSELKAVAFSGRYADLEGTPTITTSHAVTTVGSHIVDATELNATKDGTIAKKVADNEQAISELNSNFGVHKLGLEALSEYVTLVEDNTYYMGHNITQIDLLVHITKNVPDSTQIFKYGEGVHNFHLTLMQPHNGKSYPLVVDTNGSVKSWGTISAADYCVITGTFLGDNS